MAGGPLSGIRVLEVAHMLAGPYSGMLLADLGADVVKIEPPGGDIGRRISPYFVGPHNTYFASLNRNKRSVCLDLASSEGQRRFAELARDAHALITNLRPAVIKKLGLTYEHLRHCNDRLVCVALTGYGLDGPYADRPAYDYVIQALTGVMALTGNPEWPPVKVGYSAVDNSAGIMAALGLVAKIVEGRGGQVDVSLHDTMLSQLNYLASGYLNVEEQPRRFVDGGHPYIVPAQIFATADGHVALFVSHDRFWKAFAQEVGRPEWITDSRFATMAARTENRDRVVAAVGEILAAGSTADWVRRLEPLGVVVAGVQTLGDALDGELTRDRDMVVIVDSPAGPLRLIGSAIKMAGYQPGFRPPPLLGEHTRDLFGPMEVS